MSYSAPRTHLDRVFRSLPHVLTPNDARKVWAARSTVDGQERQRSSLPSDARDGSDHLQLPTISVCPASATSQVRTDSGIGFGDGLRFLGPLDRQDLCNGRDPRVNAVRARPVRGQTYTSVPLHLSDEGGVDLASTNECAGTSSEGSSRSGDGKRLPGNHLRSHLVSQTCTSPFHPCRRERSERRAFANDVDVASTAFEPRTGFDLFASLYEPCLPVSQSRTDRMRVTDPAGRQRPMSTALTSLLLFFIISHNFFSLRRRRPRSLARPARARKDAGSPDPAKLLCCHRHHPRQCVLGRVATACCLVPADLRAKSPLDSAVRI